MRAQGTRQRVQGTSIYIQCKQHIAHANDRVWRDHNPLQTVHYSQYTYKLVYYTIQSQLNDLPFYKVKIFTAHTYIKIFDKSYIQNNKTKIDAESVRN